MREAPHMEHRVRGEFTGLHHEGALLQLVGREETDRAVLDTGIAPDAPGGLLVDGLPHAARESTEILPAPLVAELAHRAFTLPAALNTLRVGCFGCKDTGFHCTIEEICTLVRADLDKRCLAGL